MKAGERACTNLSVWTMWRWTKQVSSEQIKKALEEEHEGGGKSMHQFVGLDDVALDESMQHPSHGHDHHQHNRSSSKPRTPEQDEDPQTERFSPEPSPRPAPIPEER